jgi:hypothetical protein
MTHLKFAQIPLKDRPSFLQSSPLDLGSYIPTTDPVLQTRPSVPASSGRAISVRGARGETNDSFAIREQGEEPKPEVSLLLEIKGVDLEVRAFEKKGQ